MFRIDHPLAWSYHRNTALSRSTVAPRSAVPEDVPANKEYPLAAVIPLPAPAPSDTSLAEAVRRRRSVREFGADPLDLGDLSTVLHTAYGVQEPPPRWYGDVDPRTVPSAGGLYPIEVYVLLFRARGARPGIYHYHPADHALERLTDHAPPTSAMPPLFFDQEYLAGAAALLVICGVPARSLWKYGARGYRYMLMEAGHVAHGANLAAAALRMESLNLGGFLDDELAALLEIDPEEEPPLYAIALGAAPPHAGPSTLAHGAR